MRKIALAGIVLLLLSLIVSGVNYLFTRGSQFNPQNINFIYSLFLTLGFLIAVGVGSFGVFRENEEFLITSGVVCIVLALLNKIFSNLLYSWNYQDFVFLLAGALMIADRFYVKRVKETRLAQQKFQEVSPEQLLKELDRLKAQDAQDYAADDQKREIEDVKSRLLLEAESHPELLKKLRVRMYKSPVVQGIVKNLIEGKMENIEPNIESAEEPDYPQLEQQLGYPARVVRSTLTDLADFGILRKDLYEKLITCPHCHQPSKVFVRNKCPKCGSHKTHMNRLIEHLKCGAIYKLKEYRKGNQQKCPKCGKLIETDPELKPVGVSFECESCQNTFSDPNQTYYCRRCEVEFELKSGELIDTYQYTLNNEVKSEARETLAVLTIADIIEKLGYKVKILGNLKGKTGVIHEFTLTASKDTTLIALDLKMSEEKLGMPTTLSSYAKLVDISATKRFIVAVPGLDTKAKNFLKANQIPFIEGQDISEISTNIIQLLE